MLVVTAQQGIDAVDITSPSSLGLLDLGQVLDGGKGAVASASFAECGGVGALW
jgi:hypothetical protein